MGMKPMTMLTLLRWTHELLVDRPEDMYVLKYDEDYDEHYKMPSDELLSLKAAIGRLIDEADKPKGLEEVDETQLKLF
jgi:hypothetical protein